jgi:transposase
VPLSLGSIANLEQATSEAIAVPVEEVACTIREQPVVHADETGWYEHSKRAWLWAAITDHLALFLIRASSGSKVAKELLGEAFAGILVSDRWSAYAWVNLARRQLCWAHLLRQFRGFQNHGPEANAIGRALEVLTETPMPRDPGRGVRALDLRLRRGCRADEQCGRTPDPPWRNVAQDQFRHR